MVRVRNEKDYENKRKQIVMYAVEALERFGYEAFSINNVMKIAGMTKGAFFYYFDSRNALISEIVNLILNPMVAAIKQVVNNTDLEPREKIKAMFVAGEKAKRTEITTSKLINFLTKKDNRPITQMISDQSCDKCIPLYVQVFIEGNKAGQFNIIYPHGSAFLYLQMIIAINIEKGAVLYNGKVDPELLRALQSKISAFELYSKQLFNFDSDTNFYTEDMMRVDYNDILGY